MTVPESAPPPFPPAARDFLARLRDHWRTRGGRLHLVPAGRLGVPGFPCNEAPSLAVAERQDFRVAWPDGGLTVREDEVLLIPADRPYRLEYDRRRHRYPAFNVFAAGTDVLLHRRNLPPEEWVHSTWRFASGDGPVVTAALELIRHLGEAPAPERDWVRTATTQTVAAVLSAAVAATAAPLRATRGGPAVAVRCRNHLRAHLADSALDVPRVAEVLGYDPDWLGRHYRQETGETIRQTLNLLRVQRARELLRRRDLSVAEVAALCGFASPSHFSRTFKRIEGNPPRTYRSYGHLEEEG